MAIAAGGPGGSFAMGSTLELDGARALLEHKEHSLQLLFPRPCWQMPVLALRCGDRFSSLPPRVHPTPRPRLLPSPQQRSGLTLRLSVSVPQLPSLFIGLRCRLQADGTKSRSWEKNKNGHSLNESLILAENRFQVTHSSDAAAGDQASR